LHEKPGRVANEVFLVLSGILSLEEIKSRPKIDGDTQHSHKSILKLDGNSEPSDGDLKVFMDEIATLQESTSSSVQNNEKYSTFGRKQIK
jgi:hypothetical protein